MNKNVYQFYRSYDQLKITSAKCILWECQSQSVSFKIYRHKTKPDIWLIKDITQGIYRKNLKYSSLREELVSYIYEYVIGILPKSSIRLVIFETTFSSLWYIFEYSKEQMGILSSYPKTIDFDNLIFSNNENISVYSIIEINKGKKYLILDKFEKNGLTYLKLLTKDKIVEKLWIKKDHEFFDLFNILYINEDCDVIIALDEINFIEISFIDGYSIHFDINATFENE